MALQLGLTMEAVCFIGDSRRDIGALEIVGLGLAPRDGERAARLVADAVLTSPGGGGAVAEGLEMFLRLLAGEAEDDSPALSVGGLPVSRLRDRVDELSAILQEFGKSELGGVLEAGAILRNTLQNEGTIYVFGNGGSAADAQHLATEIMGFFRDSPGVGRSISLNADTALVTALANDAGYEEVFARQIALHARAGDAAVAFSTSGSSENILRGLTVAREKGLETVLVTGAGAPVRLPADVRITVPSTDTQRIQEVHGLVIHLLCELSRGE